MGCRLACFLAGVVRCSPSSGVSRLPRTSSSHVRDDPTSSTVRARRSPLAAGCYLLGTRATWPRTLAVSPDRDQGNDECARVRDCYIADPRRHDRRPVVARLLYARWARGKDERALVTDSRCLVPPRRVRRWVHWVSPWSTPEKEHQWISTRMRSASWFR